MKKISQVMTWRKEQQLRGDVELIGTYKVMSISIIKREVAGDDRIEEAAKRQAADVIHNRLYGEVQDKLLELERMLLLATPGDFVAGDGPIEKLWELQSMISGYK